MRRLAVVIAALSGAATMASAQAAEAPRLGTPTLSAPRIGGQVVAGAYAGFLGFYIGRFTGERLSDLLQLEDEGGVRRGAVLSLAYAGAAFGTAGAVYGIGSIGNQTGEFGGALMGTGLGFLAAVGVNHLLFPKASRESGTSSSSRRLTDAIEILLPAIGSTIAFNSTRRYTR
jgi:hypothetical protein